MKKKIIVENGYKLMATSNVAICSIVRDCEKALDRNIPIIEKLRSKFKDSQVIVFENDSLDNTKTILKKWSEDSANTIIKCDDFNEITIPKKGQSTVNKYFSSYRISKMTNFRNQYMEALNNSSFNYDYLIVIDLDISKFSIDGIAHSFGLANQWKAVSANGYSYSAKLKRRYHDTYALVEIGMENISQDEETITENQKKWGFLKLGMPLIPVYSAFGGLSIYKSEVVRQKKYDTLLNHDDRVEVRCEHFSLHQQIQNEAYNTIFINPNMEVLYQNINFSLVIKFIKEKIFAKKK